MGAALAAASYLDLDLEYTALGVVFSKADLVCEYVTILAKTNDEAEVKNSQTQGAAWMRFARVTPIFGSQTSFAVEGVTPISKCVQFDMSDGEPRLLVGTPTKSGDQITLLCERMFRVKTSDLDIYQKEMTAVHETLQGDKNPTSAVQTTGRFDDRANAIQKVCAGFPGPVMSAFLLGEQDLLFLLGLEIVFYKVVCN